MRTGINHKNKFLRKRKKAVTWKTITITIKENL
jgi:hypothetical protein